MMRATRQDHDISLHLCHAHGAALTEVEKQSLNIIASSWACDENWADIRDFNRLRDAEAKCDCHTGHRNAHAVADEHAREVTEIETAAIVAARF
jgi:hypothetical protein